VPTASSNPIFGAPCAIGGVASILIRFVLRNKGIEHSCCCAVVLVALMLAPFVQEELVFIRWIMPMVRSDAGSFSVPTTDALRRVRREKKTPWRYGNYETNLETILDCGIDHHLRCWTFFRPDL
jgi:hypothetical protein